MNEVAQVKHGNYGFGFGAIAKRLRGRVSERRNEGRYNKFTRSVPLRIYGNGGHPIRKAGFKEWGRKHA